jgi:rod shape-determining protein MreC
LLALLLLQTSPRLNEGVAPIRTAASDQLFHVTRPSLIDRISGASARERRILELEARVRELAQYKALALTMAERLEVYEDILNMQGEPGGAEVTARIMAETNGPFAEALLANAGATNGVAEGYYAENDRGLVGRVVQVGNRSSRILKVTDFNSRVPVMGEASGLRAIMFGGRDNLGRLTDLPEQGDFLPNERILTSGEGGLFPRGVVVGYVRGEDGKEIKVDLAMLSGQLSYVRLKPTMTIDTPESDPVSPPPVELADGDRP